MAREGRRPDQGQRHDRRDLDRQGRPRAALARERHRQRAARRGGRHRHRRPGDRADRGRRRGRPQAAPARRRGQRRRAAPRPPPPRPRTATRVSPVAARAAAAEGVDLGSVSGSGREGRITKSDVLDAAAGNGAAAAAQPATPRRGSADARRRGGAGPLHGAVALDPHRDELPHDHRHDARRAPPAAQGGRPQGLLHPPDRLRDRARGGADAGDGQPLRGDRRQAAPHRRRPGEPRPRRRRREEGRLAHADGPRDPDAGKLGFDALPRRLRRARREGAHEHADRR